MEDLEVAITYHRQALALQPFGKPNYSYVLHKLGRALFKRFHQLGRMDFEEAITYHREALALLSHGHPHHYDVLNNVLFPFASII